MQPTRRASSFVGRCCKGDRLGSKCKGIPCCGAAQHGQVQVGAPITPMQHACYTQQGFCCHLYPIYSAIGILADLSSSVLLTKTCPGLPRHARQHHGSPLPPQPYLSPKACCYTKHALPQGPQTLGANTNWALPTSGNKMFASEYQDQMPRGSSLGCAGRIVNHML